MRADIVVGLNYGSEAKGKVCQYLVTGEQALSGRCYDASMRVQSIQAGHTIFFRGQPFKMRTIPCAWVNPDMYLLLGPGCFIEKELLLREVKAISDIYPNIRERLIIDYRAFYVTEEDRASESGQGLVGRIGSTGEGAGASLVRKLMRQSDTRVKSDDWAYDHGFLVKDTLEFADNMCVLVEGCQGTMLSIHTSPYFPFLTSRECTASGIAAEAGIAPSDVKRVHGVFRTFPIRVGGRSGDTGGSETTWGEVGRSRGREIVPERTTVTNRQRRIFAFSLPDLKHAFRINRPDCLYLTFVDYLNAEDEGKTDFRDLSLRTREWIARLEAEIGGICWFSTGQDPDHYIRRNKDGLGI
jgi:adenylosuccinate synthase